MNLSSIARTARKVTLIGRVVFDLADQGVQDREAPVSTMT
jgi:hypothetical protein